MSFNYLFKVNTLVNLNCIIFFLLKLYNDLNPGNVLNFLYNKHVWINLFHENVYVT